MPVLCIGAESFAGQGRASADRSPMEVAPSDPDDLISGGLSSEGGSEVATGTDVPAICKPATA